MAESEMFSAQSQLEKENLLWMLSDCTDRKPVTASGVLTNITIVYHYISQNGCELCFRTCEHDQTYEVW